MEPDKTTMQRLARVKQEFVVASVQQLLQRITHKCFKKCIDRPGIALDATEQKCLSMCMDRYMDSWSLVSQTFSNRVQRETHPVARDQTQTHRPVER